MRAGKMPVPLIILDVQHAIDQPNWDGKNNPDYLTAIQRLLKRWRDAEWPVVHIKHNEPAESSTYHTHGPWNAIKPEVAPLPGERVVEKEQNCAFVGTELHDILTEMQAVELVLVGVVIHNSMDATIRAGKALGYRILLPSDATTAVPVRGRDGLHWDAQTVCDLTLSILDGEYAQVTSSSEVLAQLVDGDLSTG